MSRIRDLAKILTASTDMATDAEVTSSIASHAAAADPHTAYLKESEFGAAGKNLVINGGFDIWQRGTSFAIGSFQYSADRWRVGRGAFESGATFSRQNADLQGFRYCIRAQRNSGNTTTGGGYLATSFETSDSLRFSGQPVVLSFYAKRSSGFTGFGISVVLQNGTGIDELNFTESNFATGANNIINSAASTLTTSWQRFTYTGTVPSNSTQLGIRFVVAYSGTAPADDYVDITGVQLEVGSVVTPFSRAGGTIQGELAACQRYYWRQVSGTNYGVVCTSGIMESTTGGSFVIQLPVPMRVAPTSIDTSNLRITDLHTTNSPASSFTLSDRNELFVVVRANASGLTANRPAWLTGYNSGTSYLGLSAEL